VDCVVGGLLEEWIVLLICYRSGLCCWWFAREVDCVVGGLLEKWIVLLVVC
jgi:hypothetical protein